MNSPQHSPSEDSSFETPPSPELTEQLADIRRKFLQQVEVHRSREMIQTPARWPIPGFLCLRHRTRRTDDGFPLLGVLYGGRASGDSFEPSVVYLCNVLDLVLLGGPICREEFSKRPRETFSSVDDLLLDGWIVD